MSYDEKLAERVRRCLPPGGDVVEKKMFGGLAFLLAGKMFVGVSDADLMVRVGPDAYEAALSRPHVRPMDFTGRPLTGYVFVGAAGSRTDASVAAWVTQSLAFVRTLPTGNKKARRGLSSQASGGSRRRSRRRGR
jgi:TfoX/Sxy family transcriptional regulator of competence genes